MQERKREERKKGEGKVTKMEVMREEATTYRKTHEVLKRAHQVTE